MPDLLAVSFSAHDFVAHDYGPESVEALEVLRALDFEIGRLLDELATRFGDGERPAWRSPPTTASCRWPKRRSIASTEGKILAQLNAAVDAKLGRTGGARLVHALEGCSLWLDRAALAAPGAPDRGACSTSSGTSWRRRGRTPSRETMLPDDHARKARDSYVPGRSGDLFVIPRYGVWLSSSGLGTSHGSSWEYDTHVPLIFWGGGVKPRVLPRPTTPYDIAPTLAAWLGVTFRTRREGTASSRIEIRERLADLPHIPGLR